jgi:hypothetical protein
MFAPYQAYQAPGMPYQPPYQGVSLRMPVLFFVIWAAYLLLQPFYIFPVGYPQPANVLLLAGLLLWILKHAVTPRTGPIETVYLLGLPFVGLTIVVNLANYAFLPDRLFIFHAVYYLYNFLVFCFVVALFRMAPQHTNRVTRLCLMAVVVLQVFWNWAFPQDTLRSSGTLENVNQLAHWALLMGVALYVVKRDAKFDILDVVIFGLLGYLQLLALSKAGMISFIALLALMMFSPSVSATGRLVVAFLLLCGAVAAAPKIAYITDEIAHFSQVERAVTRLTSIGTEMDDSAEARGYTRIFKYPEYLFLGAGEGPASRFNARQEIHSGLMTILFSYGIVGFFCFGMFLWAVVRGLPLHYSLLLVPVFLYGLTHQNMRFTLLWVVLALIYAGRYFDLKGVRGSGVMLVDQNGAPMAPVSGPVMHWSHQTQTSSTTPHPPFSPAP